MIAPHLVAVLFSLPPSEPYMSSEGITVWRRLTSMALIAAAVLVVVAWNGDSSPAQASPRQAKRHQGGDCPLTVPQQVNSIKAFQKMIPVFRSARCSNCHGGIADPLGNLGAVSHMGVVEIKAADGPKVCEECHMEQWHVAPMSAWAPQSDLELCRFMKEGGTGAEFIDHILRDNGGPQFIAAAFRGMRGLTEGGESIVEDDLGKLSPAPPPGTHAQLVQQAREWVKAQGGSFVGDNNCGCSLDRLSVEYVSTMTVAEKGVTKASSHIMGVGHAVLTLGPDQGEPDYFATTGPDGATSSIKWTDVRIDRGNGCVVTVQSSPQSEVMIWLGIGASPDLKLTFQFVPSADVHSVQTKCRNPATGKMMTGMPGEKEAGLFTEAWIALHSKTVGAGGPSMPNLTAMDPAKMMAMAEQMRGSPGNAADGAQMQQMMKQVLPNADAMLAEARNNFTFTVPGEWCRADSTALAICEIERTVTVPAGVGTSMTITEQTQFTFSR